MVEVHTLGKSIQLMHPMKPVRDVTQDLNQSMNLDFIMVCYHLMC